MRARRSRHTSHLHRQPGFCLYFDPGCTPDAPDSHHNLVCADQARYNLHPQLGSGLLKNSQPSKKDRPSYAICRLYSRGACLVSSPSCRLVISMS